MKVELAFFLCAASFCGTCQSQFTEDEDTTENIDSATTSMPWVSSAPPPKALAQKIEIGVQTSISFPNGRNDKPDKSEYNCNCDPVAYKLQRLELQFQLINRKLSAAASAFSKKLVDANVKIESRLAELSKTRIELDELLPQKTENLDSVKKELEFVSNSFYKFVNETVAKGENSLFELETNVNVLKTKDAANAHRSLDSVKADIASMQSLVARTESNTAKASNTIKGVSTQLQTISIQLSQQSSKLKSLQETAVTNVGFEEVQTKQLYKGSGWRDMRGYVVTGIENLNKGTLPDNVAVRKMKIARNGWWVNVYGDDA